MPAIHPEIGDSLVQCRNANLAEGIEAGGLPQGALQAGVDDGFRVPGRHAGALVNLAVEGMQARRSNGCGRGQGASLPDCVVFKARTCELCNSAGVLTMAGIYRLG